MKKTNHNKYKVPHSSLPNPTVNPNLSTSHILTDLCGICSSIVEDDHKSIICDKCGYWVHTACSNVSDIQYEYYQVNHDVKFDCSRCKNI